MNEQPKTATADGLTVFSSILFHHHPNEMGCLNRRFIHVQMLLLACFHIGIARHANAPSIDWPSSSQQQSVQMASSFPAAGECPTIWQRLFCYNGGQCLAHSMGNNQQQKMPILACRCAQGFHGFRCQHTFDPAVYFLDATGFDRFRRFVGSQFLSILLGLSFVFCSIGLIYNRMRMRSMDFQSPVVHL